MVDVGGQRVFAFQLQSEDKYQPIETSSVLPGLPIELLTQTVSRLKQESNINTTRWFSQQLAQTN